MYIKLNFRLTYTNDYPKYSLLHFCPLSITTQTNYYGNKIFYFNMNRRILVVTKICFV